MGGTLTIRHGWSSVIVSTALRCVERVVVDGSLSGTLLGPEGAAARSASLNAGPSELQTRWVWG
jgi:hypothetical protein